MFFRATRLGVAVYLAVAFSLYLPIVGAEFPTPGMAALMLYATSPFLLLPALGALYALDTWAERRERRMAVERLLASLEPRIPDQPSRIR